MDLTSTHLRLRKIVILAGCALGVGALWFAVAPEGHRFLKSTSSTKCTRSSDCPGLQACYCEPDLSGYIAYLLSVSRFDAYNCVDEQDLPQGACMPRQEAQDRAKKWELRRSEEKRSHSPTKRTPAGLGLDLSVIGQAPSRAKSYCFADEIDKLQRCPAVGFTCCVAVRSRELTYIKEKQDVGGERRWVVESGGLFRSSRIVGAQSNLAGAGADLNELVDIFTPIDTQCSRIVSALDPEPLMFTFYWTCEGEQRTHLFIIGDGDGVTAFVFDPDVAGENQEFLGNLMPDHNMAEAAGIVVKASLEKSASKDAKKAAGIEDD